MNSLMLFTALASGAVFAIVPAAAQTDESPAPAAAQTEDETSAVALDTVTVTAQRREQSAQDVGIALTVFSGADLIDKGVQTINTLENFTPNLEIESQFGSGQPSFSLRGVGFRDYATNNSPTVGVYVDDVAYPVPIMTQGVLFDVERVEVLRGPQGTLYGRNTTGGAIKVVSSKPTDEWAAGATVEGGSYRLFTGEGYVSGPITDKVRMRLSGSAATGGAWQVNRETGEELGDQDRLAVRGLVEADITDTFNLLFNVHAYSDESDGLGLQLFNSSVFGPSDVHTGRQTSWGSSQAFVDLVGLTATDQKPFKDNQGFGASITANLDLGAAELVYIGSYEDLDRKEFNDYDATSLGAAAAYFESEVAVVSHEARLQSTGDAPLQWIGGVYSSQEDLTEVYQSDFVASFGPGFAVTTPYSQEVQTLGVFGQADFQVNDLVNLVAGLRYEEEDRDLIGLGTFAVAFGFVDLDNPGYNFANGTVDGTLEDRSQSLSEVTWKAGVELTPSDDVLIYGSVSRGIKSGGFTAYNTLNPRAIDPFDPEELLAYEAGFKSDLADNLRLNGSVFFYDYQNQQVQSAFFDSSLGAIVGSIVNAPESEIYGAELELAWSPMPGFEISQALGYKTGEFNEFFDLDVAGTAAAGAEVLVDRSGESLGFPEVTYQGAVSYEGPIKDDLNWLGAIDYSYRDDTTPPLLGDGYTVDAYWLVNAQLGLASTDGSWEVALFARNLFDEDYDEVRNFFTPGADVAAPGLPQTFGARLSVAY